ncbi:MAG: stage III sporulation protein AF [Clostridiales bacterium]|nr:stage III sporulation protein AF [Clostridiales bacterium]
MDVLIEIVRGVAVLVILALFLEMLLPEGGMRSFARLVTGLLLIVAVVNPVISAFGKIPVIPFLDFSGRGPSTEEILRQGGELGAALEEQARLSYQEELTRQISALALLAAGVQSVETAPVFERDKLVGAVVKVKAEDGLGGEQKEALGKKIVAAIADFFGIEAKKVTVEMTGGG